MRALCFVYNPIVNEPVNNTESESLRAKKTLQIALEKFGDRLDHESQVSLTEEFFGVTNEDDFMEACSYLLTMLIENEIDEKEYFEFMVEAGITEA